jgi:hypothetical protein
MKHLDISAQSLASVKLGLHGEHSMSIKHILDLGDKLAPVHYLSLETISPCDAFLNSLGHQVLTESQGPRWLLPGLQTLSGKRLDRESGRLGISHSQSFRGGRSPRIGTEAGEGVSGLLAECNIGPSECDYGVERR